MICFILLILAKKPGKDGSQASEDAEAEKKSKISKLEEVQDVFSNLQCYSFVKIDAPHINLIFFIFLVCPLSRNIGPIKNII